MMIEWDVEEDEEKDVDADEELFEIAEIVQDHIIELHSLEKDEDLHI